MVIVMVYEIAVMVAVEEIVVVVAVLFPELVILDLHRW